eukprot:CAMPEP_0176471412 /NCGR_PEP_ID=MMETSP0127-20121128/41114_1 /TAXON_ID=938130 /ORGANISM="Platyophrya macrostoma, Strain WH" /LENGTH=207 /DNA_ID=CAMNT_0017866049 /DNA_START=189 /DNA_END=812 /DNA_ORIENTATION=+
MAPFQSAKDFHLNNLRRATLQSTATRQKAATLTAAAKEEHSNSHEKRNSTLSNTSQLSESNVSVAKSQDSKNIDSSHRRESDSKIVERRQSEKVKQKEAQEIQVSKKAKKSSTKKTTKKIAKLTPEIAMLLHEARELESAAALIIQKYTRGYLVRKKLNANKLVVIQKEFNEFVKGLRNDPGFQFSQAMQALALFYFKRQEKLNTKK